jgi:alanine-synthesizing transaminase
MRVGIADRVKAVSYAIRDLVDYAEKLETEGKRITYLNIGDPGLHFDTPEHLKEAVFEAIQSGFNRYAPSKGLPELREAICYKEEVNGVWGLEADDVIVTAGISEGIQMFWGAIADPVMRFLFPDRLIRPISPLQNFLAQSRLRLDALRMMVGGPIWTILEKRLLTGRRL